MSVIISGFWFVCFFFRSLDLLERKEKRESLVCQDLGYERGVSFACVYQVIWPIFFPLMKCSSLFSLFLFCSLDCIIWWAKLLLFLFSTFWQAHLTTYPILLTVWLPWIKNDVTVTPRWLPNLLGLLTFKYSFLLSCRTVHMLSCLYSFILQGSVSKKDNRNGREPGIIFTGHKQVWKLLEHSE